jgi:hypothetical protein
VVGKYSLPEPDIAVVRGAPGAYEKRHPDGNDTVLVVELALRTAATWSRVSCAKTTR